MNNENLIPVTQRSKSEARELSKKGGIASGKARREKRNVIDELRAIMQADITKNGMTGAETFAKKIFLKAVNDGDIAAARLVMSYLYGLPTQQIDNISSDGSMSPQCGIDLSKLTAEQLLAIQGLKYGEN